MLNMVSITDYPIEIYEALVGKGRITLNLTVKHQQGILKQCIRLYFEFKNEDEIDY